MPCPESDCKNPNCVRLVCFGCKSVLPCSTKQVREIVGGKCSTTYIEQVLARIMEAPFEDSMISTFRQICDDCCKILNERAVPRVFNLAKQIDKIETQIAALTEALEKKDNERTTPAATAPITYASVLATGKRGLPIPSSAPRPYDQAQTDLVRVCDWEREIQERQRRELNIVINGLIDDEPTDGELRQKVDALFKELGVDPTKIKEIRTIKPKETWRNRNPKLIVHLSDLATKQTILSHKRTVLTQSDAFSSVFIGGDPTPWQAKKGFDLRQSRKEAGEQYSIDYNSLRLVKKRPLRK